MKNCILTTLSDLRRPDFSSHPEVDLFLDSQRRNTEAELVIFSDKLNRQLPHIAVPTLSGNIILDRWLYYYHYLCTATCDQVLLIDSRDVYFQSDPFAFADHRVHLSCEGITHAESPWNTEDQRLFEQHRGLALDYSLWPVVNGGVVMGPPDKVRAYCLLIYTNAMRSPTHTDQAAINLLYNTSLVHDPDYTLAHPARDTFCLTGDAVKEEVLSFPTLFSDGMIKNGEGVPYALFHQWERTDYRDAILTHNSRATGQNA